MKKELSFIQQSECEITGQPSSKRVNARRAMWIVTGIVITLCIVILYAVFAKIDIKPNVLALCFAMIGLITTLLGFAGWVHAQGTDQSKSAMDAKIVTDLNASEICPPAFKPSQLI